MLCNIRNTGDLGIQRNESSQSRPPLQFRNRYFAATTMAALLQTLVFFTSFILSDVQAATPESTELSSIQSGDVTSILNIMQEYGLEEKNKVDKNWNQYLVVVVASKQEMEAASTWKSLPTTFTKSDGDNGEMRRVAFLLNWNNHGCQYYNLKKPLHGEVQFIDFGYIGRLIKNFRTDVSGTYPFLLLYSHYIPCADIPNLGYSCAEELMNYARGRQSEFGVIVGYSKPFINTNEKCSLNLMKKGGIVAFQKLANTHYEMTVPFSPPQELDDNTFAFQQKLYQCMLDGAIADCCEGGKDEKEKMVAYFTNKITSACTSNSRRQRLITAGGANELRLCIGQKIKDNANGNCDEGFCVTSDKPLKQICCLNKTLENNMWSMLLGTPDPPNDLQSTHWTPRDDLAWKDLYPVLARFIRSLFRTSRAAPAAPVMCKKQEATIWPMCSVSSELLYCNGGTWAHGDSKASIITTTIVALAMVVIIN